jgi:hypothetical protein
MKEMTMKPSSTALRIRVVQLGGGEGQNQGRRRAAARGDT